MSCYLNEISAFCYLGVGLKRKKVTFDRFLPLLGGSMRPVVWDVIGSELTLREHVARQAGVNRVTVYEASGRLIMGLDILARAWL